MYIGIPQNESCTIIPNFNGIYTGNNLDVGAHENRSSDIVYGINAAPVSDVIYINGFE